MRRMQICIRCNLLIMTTQPRGFSVAHLLRPTAAPPKLIRYGQALPLQSLTAASMPASAAFSASLRLP